MVEGKAICIEPHLFGSIAYFQLIGQYETLCLNIELPYRKQTNRSRFEILMADGRKWCIIPVHYHSGSKLSDVRIDYHQNWERTLIRTLKTAYNSSPFYEYYEADIVEAFNKKHEFLYELSLDILTFCLKCAKLDTKITVNSCATEQFEKVKCVQIDNYTDFFDGAKSYNENFTFLPKVYRQVFGNEFEENLSILDAFCNTGPEIRQILF